jgi:hypothetical protein
VGVQPSAPCASSDCGCAHVHRNANMRAQLQAPTPPHAPSRAFIPPRPTHTHTTQACVNPSNPTQPYTLSVTLSPRYTGSSGSLVEGETVGTFVESSTTTGNECAGTLTWIASSGTRSTETRMCTFVVQQVFTASSRCGELYPFQGFTQQATIAEDTYTVALSQSGCTTGTAAITTYVDWQLCRSTSHGKNYERTYGLFVEHYLWMLCE